MLRLGPSLLAAAAVASSAAPPSCRCLPSDACWAAVPWAQLNASVGGRLVVSRDTDPMLPCALDVNSSACAAALAASDDEFALTAAADGFTRTGLFNVWNVSETQSAYAVLAQSESDVVEAVTFAAANNLRLTVKGTGHGWFHGSSAAGALMVVTHFRKAIDFLPDFSPSGCGAAPVPAVRVQSGVQFNELYAAAADAGRFVVGGTCDSVGVGGCWLGGCHGTFSKLYSSAAANLLEVRVVLANGSLVVANACSSPDLFYALRGGGGGTFGIVTEFVARTHAPPQFVGLGSLTITATGEDAFVEAMTALLLNYSLAALAPPYGGGIGFGRGKAHCPPTLLEQAHP